MTNTLDDKVLRTPPNTFAPEGVIITTNTLKNFGACKSAIQEFDKRFPDGLDISGIWGSKGEADEAWKMLFADALLREHVSWAMRVGILPTRLRANLGGVNLAGFDLRGANLYQANLAKSDLSAANLRRANLEYACLYRADLYKANLSAANLIAANLSETILRGANLHGAIANEYTSWPEGFDPVKAGVEVGLWSIG